MIPIKTASSFREYCPCVLTSAVTALVMTACCAGLLQAQSSLPSADGGSHAVGARQGDNSGKLANYSKLPLSFAANQGQSDPRVRFTSRGSGYSLFLTDSEAVLALSQRYGGDDSGKGASLPMQSSGKSPSRDALKTDVVRMQLVGASSGLKVSGEEKLPGSANYFIGNDPKKWHVDVPTYSKVKYSGVYPGIDLVYYGNQQQLEYDFVVAPGVDPKEVKLHFSGARLSLNAHGDLMVTGKNGKIAFEKPVMYQFKSGSAGERDQVNGRFTLLAANTVGFVLGNYDKSRAVVIDPILAYSTYLGGHANVYGDKAFSVAVDSAGDAFVTGVAYSSNFPVTDGAVQRVDGGAARNTSNAFVTKLNNTGTALEYSTYLGGGGNPSSNVGDIGYDIAVDSSGEAYVSGLTGSSNFPVTPGALQTVQKNHSYSAFVTKLNSQGNDLIYSTYLGGGPNESSSTAIAIDASGNAYVTGKAVYYGFPVTKGAYQTTNHSLLAETGSNAFVSKLNSQGTGLVYSTYLGGSTNDFGNGIAVDASGDAYVVGNASSTDFPVTAGAFQVVNNAANQQGFNIFVTKLNSSGTALEYSTYLGGSYADNGNGIAIDASGHAYVTGGSASSDFPVTPGAFQSVNKGADAIVAKLNPSGTALDYATYLGGSSLNTGSAIAVDASGNAYVSGTADTDGEAGQNPAPFPTTPGAFQSVNYAAGGDAFLTKLNKAGSALAYSTYLGGNDGGPADGYGVAVDMDGNAYVAGFAGTLTFPVTPGAFQTKNKAGQTHPTTNAFVTKFALGQPVAQFSTILETFPNAPFNSSSAPPVELLTVTNVGTGTLNFTTAVDSPNYTVLSDGENTCTTGITAGQSCTLPVEFVPSGIGTHTNTLTLTPASGIGASVNLRGTATGIGDVSESPLQFGSIAYGTTKTLPLVVANYGVAGSPTVSVSFNNASYSLASGGTCVTSGVAVGQQCTLMIKFSPVGHGVHNAGIILTPSPSSGAAASIVAVLGSATP